MNPNFQDAESHCAVKATKTAAPKATKAATAAPRRRTATSRRARPRWRRSLRAGGGS